MSNEIIVGLDIGTTKIVAIVGRLNEYGKVDVLGVGKAPSTGVSRGVVTNIPRTVESIQQAIKEAEAQSDIEIRSVHVGIAGQHIKGLRHRGLIVRNNADEEIGPADVKRLQDDMQKLVMQPGEEIIHIIPQEYNVDAETGVKDPIGMTGVRLECNFHIITGQLTAVKYITKCIERAGLGYSDIILEPIASAAAVLSEEEMEQGVVLVDIGGGTTDVAIFQEGILRHTAVIALGGNIITNDIKEGCAVMLKQAELMKTRYGSALSDLARAEHIVTIPSTNGMKPKEISLKNLAAIVQARAEEILEHVHFEIRCSGYAGKLHAGMVLTGGGAQLKHLPQLASFVTGMDARIGYPNEHLALGMTDEVKSPLFATGVGLVIKGLQATKENSYAGASASKPAETAKDTKTRNWWETLLSKGKNYFKDDIEDFQQ